MKDVYTAPDGSTVEVRYDEASDNWFAELDDEPLRAETLTKLKEKIDRRLSPKAKARRIPAFFAEYSGPPVPCVATSLTDRGAYIRISFGKKNERKQVSFNYVYADTPENRKLIEEIIALHEQENSIYQQQQALKQKLAAFDVEQLKD